MRTIVVDPFHVVSDETMPGLVKAQDPIVMQNYLVNLKYFSKRQIPIRLKRIRVVRYKRGKRCLIEYDLGQITLLGKIRSRHSAKKAYKLQKAFRRKGFDDKSSDGISVPTPIGVIPELSVWFQKKIPGQPFSQLLTSVTAENLVKKVVLAAYKIHQAKIPTDKIHTMYEELAILHEKLPLVWQQKPKLKERIEKVLEASTDLGNITTKPKFVGIHRDFYPDQVIVNNDRLYIVDFDLYCQGDCALDIGNFIAHITEQSLRNLSDAGRLKNLEKTMEELYVALKGEKIRSSIHSYTTLSLVRHIYLSTNFEDRKHLTEQILKLCEQRLGLE